MGQNGVVVLVVVVCVVVLGVGEARGATRTRERERGSGSSVEASVSAEGARRLGGVGTRVSVRWRRGNARAADRREGSRMGQEEERMLVARLKHAREKEERVWSFAVSGRSIKTVI